MTEEKTMKTERIYEGKIISVRVDTVELPDRKYSKREIVEHPGAVGVLPVTDQGKIILVKQFRKSVEENLLEIPAGKIEPDEKPEICAKRELEEETGISARNLEKMVEFYTSPGFSNEIIHLFLARDITQGLPKPDEDEYIEIVSLSLQESIDKIQRGEIKDSKTIVAILLYKNFFQI